MDGSAVVPPELDQVAGTIGDGGGTPLAVSDGGRVLGIVHLKDVVKGGIAERFARFRAMGIRTVMITGDNPRTAARHRQGGRRRRLPGRGDARRPRCASSRRSRPRASWWP